MSLADISKRDVESGQLWFTGPASFTALAARDRRTLLAEIAKLNNDLTACQLEAGALKALNLRLHLRCDALAYLHYGPAAPREAVAGDVGFPQPQKGNPDT